MAVDSDPVVVVECNSSLRGDFGVWGGARRCGDCAVAAAAEAMGVVEGELEGEVDIPPGENDEEG